MSRFHAATSMPPAVGLQILPEQAELREKAPEREEEDRQNPNRDHDAIGRQVLEHGRDVPEIDDEEHDVQGRDRSRHDECGEASDPALGPAEWGGWCHAYEMVRPKGFEPLAFCSGGRRSIQLSYGRELPAF